MHQDKYSLTWHTYSDHLKSMMKELMMNEDYSDVTLVTEDKKQIKANISILSACSPVFKDILKKEKNSCTIMYLRGIQYSEIESILQFIYLGEASFNEERMDELIAVAKSLEIKEFCNAEAEPNDEPEDEILTTGPGPTNENLEEQIIESDHFTKQPPQERKREVVSVIGKYECEPCEKTFVVRQGLYKHKKSVHQSVRYACDQCEFKATQKINLTRHIQTKHEGVKYACYQCEFKATQKNNLTRHIQSEHEGVKFACNQCDFLANRQDSLTRHIQSKHEGVKYICDQCDFQATQQFNLKRHMQSMHYSLQFS